MKFSVNSKYKLWIIIAVSVLVVGFTLLSIFGFNQTPDYKTSKEVVVTMDTQDDASPEELETISRNYLSNVGVNINDYATKTVDGPAGKYSIIFKVADGTDINAQKMEDYVNAELSKNHGFVEAEVAFNDVVKPYNDSQIGWICLAIGLTAVAIFIYLFFMEKVASAISVIGASFISALLCLAIIGGARIPAEPFVFVATCFAFALSSFLSTGMVGRMNEELKMNQALDSKKQRLSYKEIADKSANDSLFRYAFILGGLVVASIVMLAVGSIYIKFLGIQIIVASVSAVFSSFVGVPLLWPVLKNINKKK